MNILVNKLPTKVVIDGEDIPVDYGFKAFILIELCFSDEELDAEDKQVNALSIFYKGQVPPNTAEAWSKLLWFYRCGHEEESPEQELKQAIKQHSQSKAYDFAQDQNLIFSAFYQQYGINLNKMTNNDLHWWEFRALFDGLSEACNLTKIMGYRTMSLKGLKGSQLEHYKKLKSIYAIKQKPVDEQIRTARREAMMKQYVQMRE